MSLKAVQSLEPQLPVVGEVNNLVGQVLIFCNGIETNLQGAKGNAAIISNAFGGRKVFVYHNPTLLKDYLDTSDEQTEIQRNLAKSLARTIRAFVRSCNKKNIDENQINITLFVHSHGAVVAKNAFQDFLKEKYQSKVVLHALGGAAMLPANLASQVTNYVFNEDEIAHAGNLRDNEQVLFNRKCILTNVREKRLGFQQAIVHQAYKDLFMELNPFARMVRNDNLQTLIDKISRYEQVFINEDPAALASDEFFKERVRLYKSNFEDYNIFILDGVPFQHAQYNPIQQYANPREFVRNLPENLISTVGNIFMGTRALGCHLLTNHLFEVYEPVINHISGNNS